MAAPRRVTSPRQGYLAKAGLRTRNRRGEYKGVAGVFVWAEKNGVA